MGKKLQPKTRHKIIVVNTVLGNLANYTPHNYTEDLKYYVPSSLCASLNRG